MMQHKVTARIISIQFNCSWYIFYTQTSIYKTIYITTLREKFQTYVSIITQRYLGKDYSMIRRPKGIFIIKDNKRTARKLSISFKLTYL